MSKKPTEKMIESAFNRAVDSYIATRREKVDPFVRENFGFKKAAWRHRAAIGWDLAKVPVNVVWSIPLLLFKLTGKGLGFAGLKTVKAKLDRIWPGFTTAVQRESERLVYEELLELPWQYGEPEKQTNALFEEILNQPELTSWIDDVFCQISEKAEGSAYRENLEKCLQQFATAQTSASEIAGNLLTIAGTYAASKQCAAGAYGAGTLLAAAISQSMAINSFVFGPALGGFWYGWFPAATSVGWTVVAVTGMAMVLAIFSTFAGILTDPLLKSVGLHQRRLRKAIDQLEGDLKGVEAKGYSSKSPILARVFDIVDILGRAVSA